MVFSHIHSESDWSGIYINTREALWSLFSVVAYSFLAAFIIEKIMESALTLNSTLSYRACIKMFGLLMALSTLIYLGGSLIAQEGWFSFPWYNNPDLSFFASLEWG